MRLFVTGGTGFIGSHFLNYALREGYEVTALRRRGSTPRTPLFKQPEWLVGDLETNCSEALLDCDTLVHFASHGVIDGTRDWKDCFRWNVSASLNLWLSAADAGVKKFIICGSCFEYGRTGNKHPQIPPSAPLEPTGAYHSSKAAATMAAVGLSIDKHIETLVLRPFHVFGQGEDERRFWPSLKRAAEAGEDFKITTGEYLRDFVSVENVAQTFVEALRRTDIEAGHPKIENIGTGTACSLRAFAESEWKRLKAKGKIIIGSYPTARNEIMSYVPLL